MAKLEPLMNDHKMQNILLINNYGQVLVRL